MIDTLETEVKRILDLEVDFLEESRVPPSSAYFITPREKFVVDQFDFRNKTKAKKLLKKIAKKHKATIVITVAEALMSKLEGTHANPAFFERKVIFAYGESKSRNYGLSREFERMTNGQVRIGNLIEFPNGSQGLMTGFMCRKYWL